MKIKGIVCLLAITAGVFCSAFSANAEFEENDMLTEINSTGFNDDNTEPLFPVSSDNPIITGNPFTPGGSGTVVDNATDEDGKEFFTIKTEDGSIYYLVIDRFRGSENVYFLNAVTKEDLLPLAKDGVSVKPNNEKEPAKEVIQGNTSEKLTATESSENTENGTNTAKQTTDTGINGTTLVVIILAVVIAGAAGFIKLRKSKGKPNGGNAGRAGNRDYEDYNTDDYDFDKE